MPKFSSATAYARAALLGNPSDLHGGCVLAFTFHELCAEVTVTAATDSPARDSTPLTTAALVALAEHLGDRAAQSLEVSYTTTIPREVGLGGSSAVVVATLRAACEVLGASLEPAQLARLAQRAETEGLGIVAGPQDRVVQAHGGLLFMDFTEATVGRIDPALLPPLYIAWREDAGQPSGHVHGGVEAGEGELREVMKRIAQLARSGRDALLGGRRDELGELMLENFELRRSLYDLDPRHVRMIELAREHGAPANYAGSGGAIVGLAPEDARFRELEAALRGEGCQVLRPTPL